VNSIANGEVDTEPKSGVFDRCAHDRPQLRPIAGDAGENLAPGGERIESALEEGGLQVCATLIEEKDTAHSIVSRAVWRRRPSPRLGDLPRKTDGHQRTDRSARSVCRSVWGVAFVGTAEWFQAICQKHLTLAELEARS